MPTVKVPESTPAAVSPSPVRRSTRISRTKLPFDPSDDVPEPAPSGKDSSAPPVHNLIGEEEKKPSVEVDITDDVEEVTHPPRHVSETWSNRELHRKWSQASAKAERLNRIVASLREEKSELLSQIRTHKKQQKEDVSADTRAEKLKLNLVVSTSEKKALSDHVSLLKNEQARLKASHKNEVKLIETTRQVNLEKEKLTFQKLLQEEKLKVKKRDLQIIAHEEKIKELADVIASNKAKIKEYDNITAQTVKANISIFATKEKASVR